MDAGPSQMHKINISGGSADHLEVIGEPPH